MLPVPTPAKYTPSYCEENVYLLLQHFNSDPEIRATCVFGAVFVSNTSKSVLLWEQRASRQPDSGSNIVWDYHCIAIAAKRDNPDKMWIYDFDSWLPNPSPFAAYVRSTFRPWIYQEKPEIAVFKSCFRVVSATTYLAEFASDRSHMTLPDQKVAVPDYPPLQGARARHRMVDNNLFDEFVVMDYDVGYGQVYSLEEFMGFEETAPGPWMEQ